MIATITKSKKPMSAQPRSDDTHDGKQPARFEQAHYHGYRPIEDIRATIENLKPGADIVALLLDRVFAANNWTQREASRNIEERGGNLNNVTISRIIKGSSSQAPSTNTLIQLAQIIPDPQIYQRDKPTPINPEHLWGIFNGLRDLDIMPEYDGWCEWIDSTQFRLAAQKLATIKQAPPPPKQDYSVVPEAVEAIINYTLDAYAMTLEDFAEDAKIPLSALNNILTGNLDGNIKPVMAKLAKHSFNPEAEDEWGSTAELLEFCEKFRPQI
jgi:transcriptional regulator with XRE-family HTH domain